MSLVNTAAQARLSDDSPEVALLEMLTSSHDCPRVLPAWRHGSCLHRHLLHGAQRSRTFLVPALQSGGRRDSLTHQLGDCEKGKLSNRVVFSIFNELLISEQF